MRLVLGLYPLSVPWKGNLTKKEVQKEILSQASFVVWQFLFLSVFFPNTPFVSFTCPHLKSPNHNCWKKYQIPMEQGSNQGCSIQEKKSQWLKTSRDLNLVANETVSQLLFGRARRSRCRMKYQNHETSELFRNHFKKWILSSSNHATQTARKHEVTYFRVSHHRKRSEALIRTAHTTFFRGIKLCFSDGTNRQQNMKQPKSGRMTSSVVFLCGCA